MNFPDSTLRSRTTQSPILESIRDRLIEKVEDYNDQNCFVDDQSIPISLPGGRIGCTISPGGGRFPSEFFTGGGADTMVEDASVIVTPIIVTRIDRPRRSSRRILGDDVGSKGILWYKREILIALFADDMWEPRLGDQPLCRDQIAPVNVEAPSDAVIGEATATAMRITISTPFDWSLR